MTSHYRRLLPLTSLLTTNTRSVVITGTRHEDHKELLIQTDQEILDEEEEREIPTHSHQSGVLPQ